MDELTTPKGSCCGWLPGARPTRAFAPPGATRPAGAAGRGRAGAAGRLRPAAALPWPGAAPLAGATPARRRPGSPAGPRGGRLPAGVLGATGAGALPGLGGGGPHVVAEPARRAAHVIAYLGGQLGEGVADLQLQIGQFTAAARQLGAPGVGDRVDLAAALGGVGAGPSASGLASRG
ncbi:hypothetical protein SMICM304S_01055 [Streptomyces microflavus]